jgi:Mannitol dehydrogenase C-terminal domain
VITITVTEVGYLAAEDSRPAGLAGIRRSAGRRCDPYEQRKLWLLNGSHSLLAYAGSIRGHGTIDEAIADPECRSWVEEFWAEAGQHLILGSDAAAAYTSALLERFGNRRVRHQLSQIAPDGSRKLPIRIFPTLRACRGSDAYRLRDRQRGLGIASSGTLRTSEGRRSGCRANCSRRPRPYVCS